MEERSPSLPLGNILMFAVVLGLVVAFQAFVMPRLFPLPPKGANGPGAQPQQGDKVADDKAAAAQKAGKEDDKPSDQPKEPGAAGKSELAKEGKAAAPPDKAAAPPAQAPLQPKNEPRQWIALGSVDPDPKNRYRMLAIIGSEGAAVARIELSSVRYRDLEDRSGYLGHLVMDNSDKGPGCLVQVVGAGTPAAKAGVKPGDRILELLCRGQTTEINDVKDASPVSLETALRQTKPDETVELVVRRGSDLLPNLEAKLMRRPLEVIRPERKKPSAEWISGGRPDAISLEENCPPSLLTTLQQVDGDKLRADEDPDASMEEELTRQLPGVELRQAAWNLDGDPVVDKEQPGSPITKVAFSCLVPAYHLKFTKTYELVKIDGDPAADVDAVAYHLVLTLQVTNLDSKPHDVAYRLDGPNGLPIEGSWYASKVQKSGIGLRDVVYQLKHSGFVMADCSEFSLKSDKGEKFRKDLCGGTEFADDHLPLFFGVDAQYFAAALLPDPSSTAPAISRALALRVGQVETQRRTLTNTSFRIIGKTATIAPGESVAAKYELFAGPKRPSLLEKYGSGPADNMKDLVYYGWFGFVAEPMTWILGFFYWLYPSYALAIILLTVVVRLAMFPMSRKQAQNAQMMQKIQPEMKEIQQKFKKDPEAARKAQQELWAKHNYNPLSGCLPLFIQMPIFLGLYRALSVNVELRDAPLIRAFQWCSNLAAPDMLYDWSRYMPEAVNSGIGFGFPLLGPMCGLGPYLNVFPLFTIALFLIQQKVMMPPPADEQAAQQQKIMKYVMVLMALMFYKVAAGLCIYFIASTLWGLAERRFLPKTAAANANADDDGAASRVGPKPPDRLTTAEREAIRRKKRGGKK
jgi:YidC/Oxa1 family membrane protein insertase